MGSKVLSKNWESTIAVLEDNIFSSDPSRWKNFILTEANNDLNFASPRFFLSLPAFHRIKGSHFLWSKAKTMDVSQNGIRLSTESPLTVGERLELMVKLPSVHEPVRLEGVVVWAEPSQNSSVGVECGVAFQDLRKISQRKKMIRFLADKICAYAVKHHAQLNAHIACETSQWIDAFRLVYKEYLNRGYCNSHKIAMHYNAYSLLPGSKTFILKDNQKMLGTVNLIADSGCGLPIDTLFGDKIEKFRRPGRRLFEVGLLALDRDCFGKKSFVLTDLKKLAGTFRLFKALFDTARANGATDLFIMMHPRHKDLYEYLTFETLGCPRNYKGAQGHLALPMHMDIERSLHITPPHSSLYRYFIEAQTIPGNALFDWDSESVAPFLFDHLGLWHELTQAQRNVFLAAYPDLPKHRITGLE